MPNPPDVRQNHLLRALPEAALQRWLPHLEPLVLPARRVLHESCDSLSHAWFPTTAIVSLLNVTNEGASTEIAVIGREGLVGMELFMDGTTLPGQAVVQSAGHVFRLKAAVAKDEFASSAPVMQLMLRCMQALMTQIAQTVVCSRHHGLSQRLCRRLLMGIDRTQGDDLAVTQEQLAYLLGVRREGVSECALQLQRLELIRYARGRVRVLDRVGLEAHACECYRVVRNEYERLLPSLAGPAAKAEWHAPAHAKA
jgi:CRP-like cAMP-binding protein